MTLRQKTVPEKKEEIISFVIEIAESMTSLAVAFGNDIDSESLRECWEDLQAGRSVKSDWHA